MSKRYNHIIIISECTSNPILEKLQAYAKMNLLSFEYKPMSIKQDLVILAHCKNVVLSRGTFCPPAILAGKKKGFLYIYDYYSSNWVLGRDEIKYWNLLRKCNVATRIEELNEKYKLSITDNWKNTDAQRNKLLESNLRDLRAQVEKGI